MTLSDPKADLLAQLRAAREALLWKLDGLDEYAVRRPLTPTGTNLLGLVKHLAGAELGYFGDTFGRPSGIALPWFATSGEDNGDMWATPEESREWLTDLYRRAWAHADATFEALPLDAVGRVPWWPAERGGVTLHQVTLRVIGDTHRHAGHADVLRELLDGSVGLGPGVDGTPEQDPAWWAAYRDRLESAARRAAGLAP
ncbi:DinB family protein (plasmid) [Streptomyces sp. BI20]|uniref:DinB family protein n=1 Tax=Streptomyces sp. BI20 TaxID=3403460 RepID=UPI003C740C7B